MTATAYRQPPARSVSAYRRLRSAGRRLTGRSLLPVFLVLGLGACQSAPFSSGDGGRFWGGDSNRTVADAAALDRALGAAPGIEPELTLLPESDLWVELRAGFALDHRLDKPEVQREIARLQRHPQYLMNLRPRLERYLPHIHAEVTQRGLPGELALLPIVESAFDPYAFSHGGAAGLWQFIPTTARRFDLPRDWWFDGRRDPVLATEAALTYLEYLHKRFDDWYLALAAYNAGEGNVGRAITRSGNERQFFRLQLPGEARTYVPRLLALAAVVAAPEEYGLTLPDIAPDHPFVTIDTHGQFDLMKAAEVLELDLDTLYQWNPALNQWATPPNGPHRLHLPAALAADAQARISAVPEADRIRWLRVEVRSGDTLSQIARRNNTDVATLKHANRLTGNHLRVGQVLMIPTAGQDPHDYPAVARATTGREYRVRAGDSLWSIGRAHGVSVAALVRSNEIGPREPLRIGQRLIVPGESAARPATVRTVRYGVRRGDSVARIASRFNVGVNQIAEWNQLDLAKYLQPGQSLLIHVDVTSTR